MLATLNSVNKGIRLTQNACEYVFISFIPKLPSPPLPPKKTEGFLFFFATAGRSSRATLVQFPTLFSSSPSVSLEISSPSLPPLRFIASLRVAPKQDGISLSGLLLPSPRTWLSMESRNGCTAWHLVRKRRRSARAAGRRWTEMERLSKVMYIGQ